MTREDALQKYGTLGPEYNAKKFFGIKYTTSKYSFRDLMEKKEYNTIIVNYAVPLVIAGVGVGYAARALSTRYRTKIDGLFTSYANEMVYHDGDFEEMKACHDDYRRRLSAWTGLLRIGSLKRDMIGKFLESYAIGRRRTA